VQRDRATPPTAVASAVGAIWQTNSRMKVGNGQRKLIEEAQKVRMSGGVVDDSVTTRQ